MCEAATPARRARSHFVAGAGVDVQAAAGKDADDGGIGAGLHRVTDGEAEGMGEAQGFASAGLEGALVVNVGGGAELATERFGGLGSEEFQGLHEGRRTRSPRRSEYHRGWDTVIPGINSKFEEPGEWKRAPQASRIAGPAI